jgi:two-component system response regulator RegA
MKYLVVDDDLTFRERLCAALQRSGVAVFGAHNPKSALEILEKEDPERAIVDLRMKEHSGLDLIPALLQIKPNLQIVVLTGYGSIATTQEAIRRGARSYLTKPCSLERILEGFEPNFRNSAKIPIPSLEQVEWEHLQRILADHDGNITHAAKTLGMDRRSLQRRLAKSPKLK